MSSVPHRWTTRAAGRGPRRAAVTVTTISLAFGTVLAGPASSALAARRVAVVRSATNRTATSTKPSTRPRTSVTTVAPRTTPGVVVTPVAPGDLIPAPAVAPEAPVVPVVAPVTAAPVTAPPTTAAPVPTAAPASADAAAMLQMVNAERAANGLPALVWDDTLGQLGLEWSQNMSVNGFRHRDLSTLRQPAGTRTGENIAWGQGAGQGVASLHVMLMNSPGHRANLLSPNFRRIGIGVYRVGDALWVTQEFAS